MNTIYIYLDQNILTELRRRKLETNDAKYRRLFEFIKANDCIVLFSQTNINEINQILKEEYQLEHLEALFDCNAIFIDSSLKLHQINPYLLWADFQHELKLNDEFGFNPILSSTQDLMKRINGIQTTQTFTKWASETVEQLIDVFDNTVSEATGKRVRIPKFAKSVVHKVVMKSMKLKPVQFDDPTQLETLLKDNNIDIEKIPYHAVLKTIEDFFKQYNNMDKIDIFNLESTSLQERLRFSYNMLNYVGYFRDDFQSIKKEKDRFRASQNDIEHMVYGDASHYLLSEDKSFRQKAKACYAFAERNTRVLSLDEFLSEVDKVSN